MYMLQLQAKCLYKSGSNILETFYHIIHTAKLLSITWTIFNQISCYIKDWMWTIITIINELQKKVLVLLWKINLKIRRNDSGENIKTMKECGHLFVVIVLIVNLVFFCQFIQLHLEEHGIVSSWAIEEPAFFHQLRHPSKQLPRHKIIVMNIEFTGSN